MPVCRSEPIDGSAVFTTAMSSIRIAVAAQTTASVQRCTVDMEGSGPFEAGERGGPDCRERALPAGCGELAGRLRRLPPPALRRRRGGWRLPRFAAGERPAG